MSVVIEHQETDMAPIVTKDGVTVFRSLGFDNSSKHVLMEAARDAAVRTASEAGDGTTTATILAEAFVRRTMEFCNDNPKVSPQRVVRTLQKLFDQIMLPTIEIMKYTPTLATAEGRKNLHAVAKISANGDTELADAVMKCFEIIGDEGNVTITEQTGPSKYLVQKIEGYPVPIGFEDSCGPFYQKFVNDPGTQTCVLERPVFLLYYGRITDFNAVFTTLGMIANLVNDQVEVGGKRMTHNVILCATGFSESVLANLAAGFVQEGTLNIYPLLIPAFPVKTGQFDFIMDLAALTGGRVFDPIEYPLQNFQPQDIGIGPTSFEATRFRSNIIGRRDDLLLLERVDQIQKQLAETVTSDLEKALLRERVAKLTSGIAKLVVQGSSHGEIKERRDRAEDAVCAVREAIKHGALPAGGVTLVGLASDMLNVGSKVNFGESSIPKNPDLQRWCQEEQVGEVARQVAALALIEPVLRLYENAGYHDDEVQELMSRLSPLETYDVLEQKWVDPLEGGLLDSLPAVREALRNSISIASLLGTCGGTVVFKRDTELERQEASDTAEFLRNINVNEANERG